MAAKHNTNELNPEGTGRGTSSVRLIEHKKDLSSHEALVDTDSQSFDDMGVTIDDETVAVTVIVGSTKPITYNPAGTAIDNTHAKLPAGSAYTMFGNKAQLDLAEFIVAAATEELAVIQHALL